MSENSSPSTPGWRHPAIAHGHTGVFLLWLLGMAVVATGLVLRIDTPFRMIELGPGLVLGAAVSALIGLARRLVIQNVATIACLSWVLAWLLLSLGVRTGWPFGPLHYGVAFGWTLPGGVPWPAPLLWVFVLITTRGVARLILRPYRKTTYYGFWVMGTAAALAVGFDISLEPFATKSLRWWMWQTGGLGGTWYGAPWINFLGWGVFTLLLLAVNTPWLLNKQPVKQPTDYHPLAMWIAASIVITIGNIMGGHWPAVAVGSGIAISAAVAAIRGATW